MMRLVSRALTYTVRDGGVLRRVVDSVDLALAPGELVLLAGPSGSGKTSLLCLLCGLSTPASGDVELEGRSIVHLRERARATLRRTDIGIVLQDLALVPDLTALENVLLPLVPSGVGRAERDRAHAELSRFGLGERAHARAGALSGGERQRVALARALVHGPSLLLLDEPTASIDAAAARDVLDHLVRTRDERGTTILVATHDPRLLDDPRPDRTLRMDAGRLATPGRD